MGGHAQRRGSSRRRDPRYGGLHLSTWGLFAVLAWTTLALGGVFYWGTFVGLGLALGFVIALRLRHVALSRGFGFWILLGLSAITLLQAAPLPEAVVRLLSPNAHTLQAEAFEAFPAHARTFSLSVDPGATALSALELALGALIYALARTSARADRRQPLLVFLAGLGLVVALVTLLHTALGATKVYGLVERSIEAGSLVGPFVNGNNLGVLLAVGALAALGVDLGRRVGVAAGLAAVALAIGVLMTMSRGALLGLVVGGFVLAIARRRLAFGLLARMGTFLLFAGAFLFSSAGSAFRRGIFDPDDEKVRLVLHAARAPLDYPWVGVGRGAYRGVADQYHTTWYDVTFTHPENWVVQLLCDYGLVLGVLVVVVTLVAVWPPRILGASGSKSGAAALAILVTLLVQGLFDLSSEIPALLGVFLAVLGASRVSVGRGDEGPHRSVGFRRLRNAGVLALLAVEFVVFFVRDGTATVRADRDRIASFFGPSGSERVPLDLLGEALVRHPGDGYFFRIAALIAVPERRVALVNAALRRAPFSGRTHLLAAELLAPRSVPQALLELRLATRYEPGLRWQALVRAIQWTKSPSLLETAVEGETAAESLAHIARNHPEPAAREELFERALGRDPKNGSIRAQLIAQKLGMVPFGTASDRITECERLVSGFSPADASQRELSLARISARKSGARAFSAFRDVCRRHPSLEPGCSLELLAIPGLGSVEIQDAARTAEERGCPTSSLCAATMLQIANVHRSHGLHRLAAVALLRRARETRTAEDFESAAGAARDAGEYALAAEAFSELETITGEAAFGAERRAMEVRAVSRARLGTEDIEEVR